MKMNITKTNVYLIFCYLCTFSMIGFWIYKYTWDEKLVTVDYKDFYESKEDVHPIMSLCFKNPFIKETGNETEDQYDTLLNEYLSGKITLDEYDATSKDTTFDLADYVLKYWVLWENGSNKTYEPSDYEWVVPKMSYIGYWSGRFFKCFSVEIPQKEVKEISLLLKNSIFPKNVRPTHWGFLVLLHYPNQLLLPATSKKYIWDPQTNQKDYELRIYARNVEIFLRQEKCIENWNDYDAEVVESHLNRTGCRPFYISQSDKKYPLCNSKKLIMNVSRSLSMDANHAFTPPCKALEKVNYKYEIIDLNGTEWESEGHFWCTYTMQDKRFKVIFVKCCYIIEYFCIEITLIDILIFLVF